MCSLYRLAETRRKRVQELEKKITELTRKCQEQNKIIKSKEKQDQRVKILSTEIQSLKETRVKLIRQMRNDANNFTKWKQSREKEINRLKSQDRKRACEMVRLKMQHDKQEIVFKRKMEEAFAVNKRLKVNYISHCRVYYTFFSAITSFISISKCSSIFMCAGCIGNAEKSDRTAREKGQR